LSLPAHGRCHNATGQPIGTHLVAGFGREDLLIQVSSQLEQARPWKERRPPICA
jgi:amidase